jgi:hypothetical protein
MNSVAAQGSVETFCLVHPADTNNYIGVYIYLDELGLLKKLQVNDRATAIAAACGYTPPPIFYGDVFWGRQILILYLVSIRIEVPHGWEGVHRRIWHGRKLPIKHLGRSEPVDLHTRERMETGHT